MKHSLQILSKIIFGLVAVGVVSLLLASPISAAEGNATLTMSPAKADINLKKGETFKGEFSLTNSGGSKIKVKIYPSAYQATNDNYKLETNSVHSQLHRWITADKEEVELEPNQTVKVHYTVKTPKDIPDGGQYAVIFAEITNQGSVQGSGVNVVSRLGMPVFASTNGTDRLAGEVFGAKIPFLQFGSQSRFSFRAKNTGNTHTKVNSSLEIKDLFGNVKYRETKDGLLVAPEIDNKIVEFVWKQSPLIALMNVTLKASMLNSSINQTKLVLFVSPIFLIILLIIIILGVVYAINHKAKYKFKK